MKGKLASFLSPYPAQLLPRQRDKNCLHKRSIRTTLFKCFWRTITFSPFQLYHLSVSLLALDSWDARWASSWERPNAYIIKAPLNNALMSFYKVILILACTSQFAFLVFIFQKYSFIKVLRQSYVVISQVFN